MKKIFKFFIAITAISLLCTCLGGCAKEESDKKEKEEKEEKEKDPEKPVEYSDINSFDISGIDQFGRSFTTVDGYKKNRQVGMFFWAWIGQPYASGAYDATKIFAMPDGKQMLFYQDTPGVSPNGQAHFWGEPLWGYYNSEDEWVIRKQLEMLTIAGVDFIYWDHTNSLIYLNVLTKVAKVLHEMNEEGWNAPKMMSYTHSKSLDTVRSLYSSFYACNTYPDTWYRVNGKPAIIAYTSKEDDLAEAASRGDTSYNPKELSTTILNFFHFYTPNWPTKDYAQVLPNGFPWIEWIFPQPYHSVSKTMSVTVASHPMVPMSFSLTRSGWENWGRGWNPTSRKNVAEDVDKGTFFQKQWDQAVSKAPAIVSVGGWNEWIAYKQIYDGEYMLCDAASKEYSRDIEPMNGGYEDAFYLQLIRNIRRYKGFYNEEKPKRAPKTIDIAGDFNQWDDVKFCQKKADVKQMARNNKGVCTSLVYTQAAPTNPITEIRASYDKDYIYIYLASSKIFSTPSSSEHNWINIYIGEGEPQQKGWESYEYLVGYTAAESTLSIESLGAGYVRTAVGECSYRKSKNMMHIAIPRDKVGLADAESFHFKVTTGVNKPGDIMNTYTSGCAMPMGRLSYQFYFE